MTEGTIRFELMKRMLHFHGQNQEAMQICDQGVQDYIGARCLVQNGLFHQGLIVAAQGVEKILKTNYRIRGGLKPFGGRQGLGHNICNIAREIKNLERNALDLTKYDSLFEELEVNYQLRYPDNWEKMELNQWTYNGNNIHKVDELMLYLFDSLPVPPEVNALTCYFGIVSTHLSNPLNQHYMAHYKWLTQNNESFASQKQKIHENCLKWNAVASDNSKINTEVI